MAARAALTNAEPQHAGIFEMAQCHHYPLHHLDTTELPCLCDLGSRLVQVMVRWCISHLLSALGAWKIARRRLALHLHRSSGCSTQPVTGAFTMKRS